MVDKILKLILLLSPIAFASNIQLDIFDSLFFRFSAIGLFLASLMDKPKRNIDISKPVISIMLLCFVNMFWHNFDAQIIFNMLNIFYGILALFVIANYAGEPRRYYKFIIIAGLINLIVFYLQRMGYNPIINSLSEKDWGKDIYGGIIGNKQRMMTYLALIMPFMAHCSPLLFLLCIATSLITKEYPILIFTTIMLLWVNKGDKRKKSIVLFTSMVGMVILNGPMIKSILIRWRFWQIIIEDICRQPLIGYGLGYTNPRIEFHFNIILQMVSGLGIAGGVWLWYIAKKYGKYLCDNTESMAIIALVVLLLIEYPLNIPRIWLTITAILGFFIIKTQEKNTKRSVQSVG